MGGWIKLHRDLLNWEWYQNPQTSHLFVYLLLKANHADGNWQGLLVKRGQLITGRLKLQQETGISEYGVKEGLKKLQKSKSIAIKSSNKYSLITICNYDAYQSEGLDNIQQTTQQNIQQKSSKNPAKIQQTATNKNKKKEKEIEEEKEYSAEISNFYNEILPLFPEKTIPKEVAQRKGWLDAIVELKAKHCSLLELKKIIQYFRKDNFWASNFMSLPKLLTKNKDGIRYIDFFAEKIKFVKPDYKIVGIEIQTNGQLKNKYQF